MPYTDPNTGAVLDSTPGVGQSLADALSGAFGHPVNRLALNSGIANQQAINGLRQQQAGLVSEQTQEAMLKAQQMRDQMEAKTKTESALGDMFEATGDPNARVRASAVTNLLDRGGVDFSQAASGLENFQKQAYQTTLADPNQLGQASQVAAAQGIKGDLLPYQFDQGQVVTHPGQPGAVVTQTPASQAAQANLNAEASLHSREATDPAAFHPRPGAVSITPDQSGKLTQLLGAGVIGPAQMYSFSRNPSLVDAAYGAFQNDPTAIAGLAHAKQATAQSFASGQDHKSLTSLNTVVGHLGLVPDLVQRLNNGDVQGFNKAANVLGVQFMGDSAPVLAQQLSEFLGRELVNAVQANGGGEREREAAQSIFDAARSPGALLDAANQATQLIGSSAHSREQEYVGQMSMGQPGTEEKYRQQFRTAFLTPETRRVIGMGLVGGGVGAEPSPNTVTPPGQPGAAPIPLDQYLKSKGF